MAHHRNPRRHEFLFAPRDYLYDPNVLRMGLEARGAYSTLLFGLWEMPEPGVAPDDPEVLRNLARATAEEWAHIEPTLKAAFDTTSRPGFWVQKRMVTEYRRQNDHHSRAIASGRLGGRRSAAARASQGSVEATLSDSQPVPLVPLVPLVPESTSKHSSAGASESARRPRPEKEPPGFPEFYRAYPRRDGRRAASRSFASALKRHPTYNASDLAWAATKLAEKVSENGLEPRFIPLPATWLNQDRFREYFDEEEPDAET